MRVAFPTSIPTIPKIDSTSVFVGFGSLLGNIEYTLALHGKAQKGARLVQAGGLCTGLNADTMIALSFSELDAMIAVQSESLGYGVLVSPDDYVGYARAVATDYVSVIAV